MVDEAVVRDSKQKGPELGACLIALAADNDFAPDLLEQIVGYFGVAGLPDQIAVEGSPMTAVKNFEGAHVPARVTQHQFAVVVRAHGSNCTRVLR